MRRPAAAAALLAAACCPFAVGASPAAQALQGYSGLLTVPDGGALAEGTLDFQFNTDRDTDARERIDSVNNFVLLAGVWRGLELGARVSDAPEGGRGDLSGSAKWRLFRHKGWSAALGVTDFAGDAQQLRAAYGAVDWRAGNWQLTGGFGLGPDRLDGAFGGIAYRIGSVFQLLADHDGNAAHAGVRAAWRFGPGLSIYGIGKLSTDERQGASAGVGLSWSPTARRPLQRRVDPHADAPRPVRRVVDSTRTPRNSLYALREASESLPAPTQLVEYRYGVPLRAIDVAPDPLAVAGDLRPAAVRWQASGLDWRSLWQDQRIGLELRFEPDLRTAVATEVGLLDYSLALQSSARLQLPLGLGGYVSVDTPIDHSDDVAPGGVYSHFRHDSGLHQAAVQWAVHPLPGLVGLNTVGRTEVEEIAYDMQHLDWVLHSPGGTHQLRLAWAEFQPHDELNFAPRRTRVAGYRYWWTGGELALRADYGEFFYGDRGGRLQLDRYMGNVILSLVYRERENGEQEGGMQLTMPLTTRPWHWGRLRVTGAPSWSYRLNTTIGGPGDANILRRGFLLEPMPQFTLSRDLLDADRAFPDYAGRQEQE